MVDGSERHGEDGVESSRPCAQDTPVDAGRADSDIPDLAALQADDALLDALGGTDHGRAAEFDGSAPNDSALNDSALNALLLAWRREVDSEPIGELVDVEQATATIAAAREAPTRHRRRLLVPVASAAAVLAIAFGGVSLAAKDAHPGDTLFGLTKVLYADHARSVMAAADIREDFGVARKAIAAGDLTHARSALVRAKQSIPTVQRDDGRADLQATRKSLLQRIDNGTPPAGGESSGDGDHGSGAAVPPEDSSASQAPASSPVTTPEEPPPSGTSTPPPTQPSTPPSNPSTPPSTGGGTNPGTGTGTHTGHVQTPTGTQQAPAPDTAADSAPVGTATTGE